MATDGTVTLMAVGDTGPYIEPPGVIFSRARDTLARATWRFAQVERTFSDRGTYNPASMGRHSRLSPHLATAYREGGFDVVSMATNHALDWGPEAFLDTLDAFAGLGIEVAGAGRTKDEAHAPVLLSEGGTTLALLAYCSVLPAQYWAEDDRPGCAPLRADSYFQALDYQPGSPARVRSEPLREDLERMVADIEAARQQADYVAVSFHWGVHFAPRTHADYQITAAHAAIDAGCDAVIGHGPHMLRGVEVYRGRPVLYSIGNFVMSSGGKRRSMAAPEGRYPFGEIYDIPIGPGLTYDHRQYQRWGAVAELSLATDRHEVGLRLLPSTVDDEQRAVVLEPTDELFETVTEFIRWQSEAVGGRDALVDEDGALRVRLD